MIAYKLGNSLYLNITNRCTNSCDFCIRKTADGVGGYDLWLDREPTADEVIEAVGDPTRYDEIVFCGYGEPMIRLDVIKEVSRRLKERGAKIRINTNGQANLIFGRNVVPELKGLIDTMSISLNAENSEKYARLCNPSLGEEAYNAMLEFASQSMKYIPRVVLTVVDVPEVDVKACEAIARSIGAEFRVRHYSPKIA
ncbi:MAG TPA: radical SAM protein [Firmicutes bacterium]|nr:radical SAM protein [Bacillota bacterium]